MANPTFQEVMDYAQSRGMSRMDAAAMAANAMAESGFRSGVKGDQGTAIGLFQHRGTRRSALADFAKARGKKETDWKAQVDFALHELKTTEKKAMAAMKAAKTPEQKAIAFSKHFERPNPQYAHNDKRAAFASEFYSQASGKTGMAPTGAPPMAGVGLLAPEHVAGFKSPNLEQIAGLGQPSKRSGRDMGDLPAAQPVSANLQGLTPETAMGFKGLQNAMGRELGLVSGYRSPSKNRMVGGAKRSQHVHGKAIDVSVKDMSIPDRLGMIEKAARQGFRGFGVGNNRMHFDMGSRRSWGYTKPSGGGKVPAWAAETVAKAVSGAFMPTPTPRPEYTPPTAVAKAPSAAPVAPTAPASPAFGFMGNVPTRQAATQAEKQYAGNRVATAYEAAQQARPDPISTSFGVMAAPGTQVVSPVQQSPQTIKGFEIARSPEVDMSRVNAAAKPDPTAVTPGRFDLTPVTSLAPATTAPPATPPAPPQQQFTPSVAARDLGRAFRGIPGAVRGVVGQMGMGQMQGPPQFAGTGLSAIMGVRSGSMGNAIANSRAGHRVGYDPNTGFTSVTNNRGVTTYSKGDIQAAGPGSVGPFGNLGARGAQALGGMMGRGAGALGIGLGGLGRGNPGSTGTGGLGGFFGGFFGRDNENETAGGKGGGGGGKGRK